MPFKPNIHRFASKSPGWAAKNFCRDIITESRAGSHFFDAVTNSGMEIHLLGKMGLLARHMTPEFSSFMADSRDPAGRWADMYSNLRLVAYNTRLVPKDKIPKRYEDLLDPVWKGQIGFPEGQYSWFATMLKTMGEESGRKFFQGLARQELQLSRRAGFGHANDRRRRVQSRLCL